MNEAWTGWLLAAVGVFAICGGAFQWGFFMNHRKAQFFVRLIGTTATRAFYIVLGSALAVAGVLIALGIVPIKG